MPHIKTKAQADKASWLLFLNVKIYNEDAEAEIYIEAACSINLPISRDLREENTHKPMFVHISLTLQES